ncbi:MAG: DUF1847 domain-containing protein [Oscillospiraceae bacterium]|nr:DUF1847 domain-containing protein [Oscillospiraceae bacterium]
MENNVHSCIDCAVTNCNLQDKAYPDFCLTTHMNEEVLADAMKLYEEDENRRSMIAAGEIEHDFYGQFTRVEEIMAYAKKMGFQKIGIATCVGLIAESRTLASILRYNGFEVYGIACKAGVQKKVDVGIPERCNSIGPNMCNPILQAKLLNEAKTELNVVMGLCVGHDSLFYKYSDALVTTLVAKDRVTGHNPVAALYGANFYFKKRMYPAK